QRAARADPAADPARHARYRRYRLLAARAHRAAQHRQHHPRQPGSSQPRMIRAARPLVLGVLAASLLAGCASGGPRASGHRLDLGGPCAREGARFRRASPGEVVAAELAFARLAQEKGQWTAFLGTSTSDAVMFVPQPVNAHEWLRRQSNPAEAVRWQPHQVWSSCDGTLAVTKGAWQRPDRSVGYFTTGWA